MKKTISILLIAIGVLFTAMPAQAQLLDWGIRGGLNLTKADFNEIKSKNYTGFFIGPMAEIAIPIIGLGVDGALLYANNGMKVEDVDGGYETIKNHALEIPVNLKYTFGLGSFAGVYFAVGPQFALSLSSDKYKFSDYSSKPFKKSELSLNLGAGVKLINHIQAGFAYNIPLGDTAEFDAWGAASKGYSSKNKTWKVQVAYIF